MIATPYEDPKDKTIPKPRKNVEIIDLTDTTFKYSFNEERLEKTAHFSLFGGLLQNHPFIGGLVNGPETPLQNCIIINRYSVKKVRSYGITSLDFFIAYMLKGPTNMSSFTS